MSYPLRNLEPNITHHIFSRCIEQKTYLKKNNMKKMFCRILKKAQKKYKFDLNGFVIMDNHFHFIITTLQNGGTIDRIMQYIKSKFARLYNKLHNRSGAYWSERYKNKVIEFVKKSAYYFNILLSYLVYNPVKASIAETPSSFIYSSFNDYTGGKNKLGIKIKIHALFNQELFQELCEMRNILY